MLQFLSDFGNGVAGQIVGGTTTQAVSMASLFFIVILVAILIAARLDLEMALIVVSPGILVASFVGIIPPLGFGIVVFILGVFWAGIILALIR